MTRPILLGMNNPISSDPRHALYPYPPGCTGARVLDMLREVRPGVTRAQYLAAFDRRNLVGLMKWSRTLARDGAAKFLEQVSSCRTTVVVFGREPAGFLGLQREWLAPHVMGAALLIPAPHPSGRNLWYNDAANRRRVAELLGRLYDGHG